MSLEQPRYVLLHRNKFLTVDAESLEDMVAKLRSAANELAAMLATGKVHLLPGGVADDYAHLVTDDEAVAERFGFQDAGEFGDDDALADPDDTDLYEDDD